MTACTAARSPQLSNSNSSILKILYSFWTVFNRQNQQLQSSRQHRTSETSLSSTAGQLSSVASSLLGSLTNFGSSNLVNLTTQSNNTLNPDFCDYALKYVNGSKDDQYIFSATLDIKEEEPKSQTFQLVPREKDFFKLIDKQINIHIQQITNAPLEIERCFGVLMCQGRNVRNKDMQLLDLVSMGKSAGSSSSYKSTGYVVFMTRGCS
ncbi:Rab GTPase-activating 1 [Brachionus plicatilis]|uniref:Rab GTPase-activating 1 n=1 Tax=Brachionus plicatilis TaxID=10195 RepID=A0A3M7S1B4_BRAPC|nr:Rab GTPase-activating 1 [Brachionus plicatilis]